VGRSEGKPAQMPVSASIAPRHGTCLDSSRDHHPFPHQKEAPDMKRILGVTLAVLFALPLAAAAEEAVGKVKTVDRAQSAFVLEDGTRLWINDSWLDVLREGDKVQATYVTIDGRKVVTEMDRRTVIDNNESTNFGGPAPKE
jgi:hypothetical protein